jgi:hypothetical protein
MAQPVWVLSVNLETKSAAFVSGLGDAAKAARGSFGEIRSGAGEMGGAVGYSMGEARHTVMMLAEEFGGHLPRALATFIAGLGPIGPALEAAFPFMAIAVGATLLIEHLVKMQEAGEKLTEDQVKFGTAVQNAFNSLDQKLIQAQIKADELKNDHLGALRLQLELIDKQSMDELVHSFELVAKAADVVMKDLEGHWYTFGIGSDGANHALQQFSTQYESLLANRDREGASGLLKGTLDQAQKILDAFKKMDANKGQTTWTGGNIGGDFIKYQAAMDTLHEAGLSGTEKERQAQEQLVTALQKQVEIEERVAAIKKQEGSNATRQTGNEEAARRAAATRQAAESQLRMGEQSIAADKTTADALMSIHRASIEERLASDIDFAGRDRDVKEAANQAEIAALDKSGKDYANQLKALQEKALEINNEYDTKVAGLKAKSSVEVYNRDLQALEQSIREQIEATQQGTAARVTVIDAGLREAQARQLQDTQFYRDLRKQRVQAARQEAEEELKIENQKLEAQIDGVQRAANEQVKHRTAQIKTQDGTGSLQDLSRVAQERQIEDMTYALQKQALQQELDLYRKMGNEKIKEAQKTQQAIDLLDKQHVDKSRDLDAQQAQDTRNALAQVGNDYAQTFMGIMTGHESLAKTEERLTEQAVSHMLQAAIQMMAGDKVTQMSHAKSAAAGAYNAMANIPIVGPELGALAAAAVFAGAMAFEKGGIVPGVGRGDIVPAMLEPGEGVLPGSVMDGLHNLARNGGFEGRGNTTVVHVRPTYHVNTIDGDGMQAALEKHTDRLQRHFENTLRRMNR